MRRVKRFLTAVLAFVMVLSMIPLVSNEVQAVSNPYPTWQQIGGVGTVPCTYYAWQQAYDRLGVALPGWGNAIDWYAAAENSGYTVGTEACVDAIAVWSISGHQYGHVAYVTGIYPGGIMCVNEGGRSDAPETDGVVEGQLVPTAVGVDWFGRTLIGFIYLDSREEEHISYEPILSGEYYLKNKVTGKFLALDAGEDCDHQNISVTDFTGGQEMDFKIRYTSLGCTLQPCCSENLVNPHGDIVSGANVDVFHLASKLSQYWGFEKVDDGFVIHNMQNEGCVLSVNGTNVEIAEETGADEQIWSLEQVSYQVSFHPNGGTNAPDAQERAWNEEILLTKDIPSRAGHTFLGWSTDPFATEATYQPGDSFTEVANTVLYAIWKINFADISQSSWQIVAAVYACNKGLMSGKGLDANGNVRFDPDNSITREEFVQVLYNAEGKPAVDSNKQFPDVAADGWYKNAVLWANSQNISSGMGNGNFGVGANITRQDLALMLMKYAALKGCSLEAEEGKIDQFADGDKVAGYAKTAMDWAVTNGILSGKGNPGADISTFKLDPTGTATRAECAAMLKNFMTAFDL